MPAAARAGALAAAVALALLCGAAVLGRPAPDDLCFADARRNGTGPLRPLGPVRDLRASDLASRISVRTTDTSHGCALALLDMERSVVPGGPRDAAVVDAGWVYQNGDCMIPLAYRQFFNCTGDALPGQNVCAGISEARIRGGFGTSDYALSGTSLVLRPGTYDSGTYVYFLGYGPDDIYAGSVTLTVGADVHKYPCGLDRGIGAALGHKGEPTRVLSEEDATGDWACGCFPQLVEVDVEWANVSAAELGLVDVTDYYEDEGGSASGDQQEKDPDLTDCRTDKLFDESDMFRNASGPDSLLIGAVAKGILTMPLGLPAGRSYEALRNASLECNARTRGTGETLVAVVVTPSPPQESAHPERRSESRATDSDFGLFGLPTDPATRRAILIGLAIALLVLLFSLAIVLICACRLTRKAAAERRARVAKFAKDNPAYEPMLRV
ncbi:glycoprotein G [Bubaline alphaherpesvirus 1]|uniref:Glycoprotein G n=1 Tax=Bubaline alphaherpesvirus 1 TaxID=202910 RepID=A0A1L5JKK1_9ALPH|nr:glycoprotein G [Bubaline alphaherpesvirus 1]APO15923.1 glycoprotein G [Bubaline alphaherpesvirus 1]WPD94525.1 US4 [Bubaline alphaherpesvirus 1]